MTSVSVEDHAQGFLDFLNHAPTVFHAISFYVDRLKAAGFVRLSERTDWSQVIVTGGRYFLTRNGSSLIAFSVGKDYRSSYPIAMIGTHMDALTMRVKPVSEQQELSFEQLKVAPYSGGGGMTWWDRDLGLAGRVMVKNKDNGKISQQLVRLPYPFAKIPSLAEHFGYAADPPFNGEIEMTPIIGCCAKGSFDGQDEIPINDPLHNHSPRLLAAIADHLSIEVSHIKEIELELFDHQKASRLGLDGELLSVPRCDDKLCSYAALEALIDSSPKTVNGGTISLTACFDDEEAGSQLRQGADSNFLPSVLARIIESLNPLHNQNNLYAATLANSFLISADVEHAVNPNFVSAYGLKPRLNIGPVLCCDAQANVTTDAVGKVMMQEIADRSGSILQLSQICNGEPSGNAFESIREFRLLIIVGGTIGPIVSSKLGVRSVDLGIVQLGMHSIRGTTGDRDPGLGVKFYRGYFEHFEEVEADTRLD